MHVVCVFEPASLNAKGNTGRINKGRCRPMWHVRQPGYLQAVWTLSLREYAALPELEDMDIAPPWPVLVYV